MKEEYRLSEKEVVITNIQRMCMNDGPGIRTTVFFKGCNLVCPWCANPENISFEKEYFQKASGAEGIYGISYHQELLYQELLKDEEFWENTNGGITFSGGEPLLHLYRMETLLKRLKSRKIHLAVETALYNPPEYMSRVLQWIDYFIVDIKILNKKLCKTVLNGDTEMYFKNLGILKSSRKEFLFRIPCNIEYTVSPGNLTSICELLREFPGIPVEIFGIHDMGKTKYESLGKEHRKFKKISEKELEKIKRKLEQSTDNRVFIQKI